MRFPMDLLRISRFLFALNLCCTIGNSLQLHLSHKTTNQNRRPIVIGGIFPQFTLNSRFYKVDVFQGHLKEALPKSTPFLQYYSLASDMHQSTVSLSETSYPMDVIQAICEVLVPKKVTAIIYVSATEKYGLATASSQYLLHMLSYTGIPVIAWNADNSGLLVNRDFGKYKLLQMAPPIEHQVQAMIKLLERYGWSKFAVVTSTLAGHQHFGNLLRKEAGDSSRNFKLELVEEVTLDVKNTTDIEVKLNHLLSSDGRIFLFYATHAEAEIIFPIATAQGLTGRNYLWMGTQSVVSNFKSRPSSFQVGMLAIHFDTSTRYRPSLREQTDNVLVPAIKNALNVLAAGLNLLVNDHNGTLDLLSTASCDTDLNYTWPTGDLLYRYLKRVSIDVDSGDPQRPKLRIKFDKNGKLKDSYLSIVNLKPNRNWEKVGYYTHGDLGIYDITWPGGETSPPKGTPDQFHMKIVTLEESPFVMISDLPPQTDSCPTGQRLCHWTEKETGHRNVTISGHLSHHSGNESAQKCCRGFCVDLLNKLASDVGFTYDLYRVDDGKWGIKQNGSWNGLMAELVNQKADMCMTALKINTDRQRDIDFSVPFHETGIAILVAMRRGALSPTAFLEPFEYSTWIFMLVVIIQASAFAIFLFEWLSPQSYNMTMKPPPGHKFSLLRAYWLVWATFFSTSVNTDVPRSHTSRFMALVWAAFSLVFLAVYTANLAAFMITRTEYHDLSGISDPRITNPRDAIPPFVYGTVMSGNTEDTLRKYYRNLYNYIAKENKFFKENVSAGVSAVKMGEYDAFIYDAVVLEYLASMDDYCEILTAGKWFSMTGYGVGFPKNSKWLAKVNKHLLKYQEMGDLERLRNFWFPGSCSARKSRDHMKHSTPLGIENFVSAFVLLAGGTAICLIILCLEYVYWSYVRPRLIKLDKNGWCGLVSLSMARSLSFREVVERAQAELKLQKSINNNNPEEFKTERPKLESPILPPYPFPLPTIDREGEGALPQPPILVINRSSPQQATSETPSGGQCFYAALEAGEIVEEEKALENEMEV